MKKIFFLAVGVAVVLQSQAWGAVEIYANGLKYNSLQAYQATERTIFIRPKELSPHNLYVLGVEDGVKNALQGFYVSVGQYNFQITRIIYSWQLQNAIQQAVTSSKYPKLLIAQPGKLRILSVLPDNAKQ